MSRLEEIKKFWLAPPFKEFEYHEQRDQNNDIEWLIKRVENLEDTIRKAIVETRKLGPITESIRELEEQNERYREVLQFIKRHDYSILDEGMFNQIINKTNEALKRRD